MDDKKIIFVLIVVMIVFALLFIGIILFIIAFRRTRLLHMEELLKTKLEIQDETLTYIGRELHDNLGQLLTVSKIHVNSLRKQYEGDAKLLALEQVIDKTVIELRALSKSLNNSRIRDFGLHRELAFEVERIQKMQVIDIRLTIEGEEKPLATDKALILYRIIQEFLANTLKYAQATQLLVSLTYSVHSLSVALHDNGIGFNLKQTEHGSGVQNIKNRLKLLNAQHILYSSSPSQGTHLSLTLSLGE